MSSRDDNQAPHDWTPAETPTAAQAHDANCWQNFKHADDPSSHCDCSLSSKAAPVAEAPTEPQLPLLRYANTRGFCCGAQYVEFAAGCEFGKSVFKNGATGEVEYRRDQAIDYVKSGVWRLVAAPATEQAKVEQKVPEMLVEIEDKLITLATDVDAFSADLDADIAKYAGTQASPAKPDLTGLTASDRETVLGLIAWLGGAAQGDRPNTSRGDAAAALQRLLAAITKEPDHDR